MWVLLLLSIASAAPSKSILRYERGSKGYTIQKSERELVFHGEPATLVIPIQPCNKEFIAYFWKDIELNLKKLSPISKRSTASEKNVSLDGNKRSLTAFTRSTGKAASFFDRLPEGFLAAKVVSVKRCKH